MEEGVALALRLRVVRVVAVVEPLAKLWARPEGGVSQRDVRNCEYAENRGCSPGFEMTSYASLSAAILASEPPSLSG